MPLTREGILALSIHKFRLYYTITIKLAPNSTMMFLYYLTVLAFCIPPNDCQHTTEPTLTETAANLNWDSLSDLNLSRIFDREPLALQVDPRPGGNANNSGVAIKITPKGMDYATSVGGNLLNEEIRTLDIPDVHEGFSGGYVQATNVRITSFSPPKYDYTLSGPNRLGFTIKGGQIAIAGNWQAKKKLVFFSIRKSGSFTAKAGNLDITLSAAFVKHPTSGAPQLQNAKCSAKVGDLSLKIKGGVLGWIVNLFRRRIAKKLKEPMERGICDEALEFVNSDVNAKLRTFPLTASVGSSGLKLNYGLTANPQMNPSSGIFTKHKGEFTIAGVSPSTFHPHAMQTGGSGRMVHFFASDYLLNTLLSQAHKKGIASYSLRNEFLQMSCPGSVCLGTVVPNLADENPTATGVLDFQTASDPIVKFGSANKITLQALINVQLTAGSTSVFSGKLILEADLTPQVDPSGRKVTGTFKIPTLQINETSTTLVDELQGEDLQPLLEVAKLVLEPLGNQEMAKGIPIPATKGISFHNAWVRVLSRTLEVSADVTYSSE